MTTAATWLCSPRVTRLLAEFRAEDRAETLRLMRKTESAEAELMRSLTACAYHLGTRLPHGERAYIGLSFRDRCLEPVHGNGMAADQRKHDERYGTGCRPAWD